jgi:transforming growth factor-beta-induced protein
MSFKKSIFLLIMLFFILFISACRKESTKDIVSVASIEAIAVNRYTSFESLGLPQTIKARLDDGSETTVLIAWDQARNLYQGLSSGEHIIEGQLILTGLLTNSLGLTVMVELLIQDVDMMTTLRSKVEFSIFVEAIENANLETFINEQSALTLFAPNNDAMLNMFANINMTRQTFFASDFLEDVVKYHLIGRKHSAEAIINFTPVDLVTLEGETINVNFINERLTLNLTTEVISADIEATNGMIHEINRVLLPSSVISRLNEGLFDGEFFELFTQFLQQPEVLFRLIELGINPTGSNELTFFAPNNEAFDDLLLTLNIDTARLLEYEGLLDILLNHIVSGTYLADDLFLGAPMSITTLIGNELEVDVIDGGLYVGGGLVESTSEIEGFGFVHVIDRFLMTDEMMQDLIDFANQPQ